MNKIKNERLLVETKAKSQSQRKEQIQNVIRENEKLQEEIEDIKIEIEIKKRAPFSKKRASNMRLEYANLLF